MPSTKSSKTYKGPRAYVKLLKLSKDFDDANNNSWIDLALCLEDIKDNERYKSWGYRSFKNFYVNEVKSPNYYAAIKLISVSRDVNLRDIKVKPGKPPPSYEALYQVLTLKGHVPGHEFRSLYNKVLKRKLSVKEVRKVAAEVKPGGKQKISQRQTKKILEGLEYAVAHMPRVQKKVEEEKRDRVPKAERVMDKPSLKAILDKLEQLGELSDDLADTVR